MKRPQHSAYCSRCGDELSADEMLQLGGAICAFCDHIHAEALEMQERRLSKPLPVRNMAIPKSIRHSSHSKPHRLSH